MTTDEPATTPEKTVPSDPADLADLIMRTEPGAALWGMVVQEHGYEDGLKLWEAAHREILRKRRARASGEPDEGKPGDKTLDGLTAALRRFVRASGLEDAQFFRGEVYGGTSAVDHDLSFHLVEGEATASVAQAFGFEHDPIPWTSDVDRRRTVHHHYRGEWQGYRVGLVWVDPDPPAPEEEPATEAEAAD